jgi:nucleoside-diphosphate-sugar epimerase
MKKILITGAAGYIGSMLSTKLVQEGYEVTAVDIFKYQKNSLNHLFFYKNFKLIKADVNDNAILKRIIKKQDFIIPLAALVGAPLCEKNKSIAIKTNVNSIRNLVKSLKKNQKIIYPTTNSGYGIGEKNSFCTEDTPINPISIYGKTKTEAEKVISTHSNYISFRLATVFGFSYRMRIDLMVNNFVYLAHKEKKLTLYEPNFRRNFVHINDIVNVFYFAIKNFSKLKNNTFNVGLDSANITKLDLVKKIKKKIPSLKIRIFNNKKDPDQRDYYVSNKKLKKRGFSCSVTLENGIEELLMVFNQADKFSKNY